MLDIGASLIYYQLVYTASLQTISSQCGNLVIGWLAMVCTVQWMNVYNETEITLLRFRGAREFTGVRFNRTVTCFKMVGKYSCSKVFVNYIVVGW